jgi:hypothetical protein
VWRSDRRVDGRWWRQMSTGGCQQAPEPFQTLLSKEVTTAAKARAATIDHQWEEVAGKWTKEATGELVGARPRQGQGLSFDTLVGAEGLEPPTPSL